MRLEQAALLIRLHDLELKGRPLVPLDDEPEFFIRAQAILRRQQAQHREMPAGHGAQPPRPEIRSAAGLAICRWPSRSSAMIASAPRAEQLQVHLLTLAQGVLCPDVLGDVPAGGDKKRDLATLVPERQDGLLFVNTAHRPSALELDGGVLPSACARAREAGHRLEGAIDVFDHAAAVGDHHRIGDLFDRAGERASLVVARPVRADIGDRADIADEISGFVALRRGLAQHPAHPAVGPPETVFRLDWYHTATVRSRSCRCRACAQPRPKAACGLRPAISHQRSLTYKKSPCASLRKTPTGERRASVRSCCEYSGSAVCSCPNRLRCSARTRASASAQHCACCSSSALNGVPSGFSPR